MSNLTIKEQIFPVCDYSNVYGPHINHMFDMSTRRSKWRDGVEYHTAAVKVNTCIVPLVSVLTNSLEVNINEYDLDIHKLVFLVNGVKRIGTVIHTKPCWCTIYNAPSEEWVRTERSRNKMTVLVSYYINGIEVCVRFYVCFRNNRFIVHYFADDTDPYYTDFKYEFLAVDFSFYKDRG